MSDWNPHLSNNSREHTPDPWGTSANQHYSPDRQLGDVVDGVHALRRELQNTESAFLPEAETPVQFNPDPDQTIEQPQVRYSPSSHTDGTPHQAPKTVFWSPAPAAPRKSETYEYTPPKTKATWMAIGAVATVVVAAGALNVLSQREQQEQPGAQVNTGDTNFSCDVNSVSENPAAGTADITFSMSAANKAVQVFVINANGEPIAKQTAAPAKSSPTEFSFLSKGMHSQRLIAKAGSAVCKGSFTLGSTNAGDEHFFSHTPG